jgi:hypothetical protein
VIERHADSGIRIFVVWQPMLASDWLPPLTMVLRRVHDNRVRQYWDPNHLLADQMKRDARPPQPEPDCCERLGVLWDLAAVYPKGASWGDQLPPAVVFNGPVVDIASEIERALSASPSPSTRDGSQSRPWEVRLRGARSLVRELANR